MKHKYNEHRIDRYMNYLSSYGAKLEETGVSSYGNIYDFELEHKLVERCEAGGILSILELATKDFE